MHGGILVEKSHGFGINWGKPNKPRIVIGPNAVVEGELRFERDVELFVHPTADTEIRVHQARAAYDESGATDKDYVEIKGAVHYLTGRQREACEPIIDWLKARF